MLADDELEEYELFLNVANFLGVLFKTHKDLMIPLAKQLATQIIDFWMKPKQAYQIHQFGLFLIDDMIEHLGTQALFDHINEFA